MMVIYGLKETIGELENTQFNKKIISNMKFNT